MIPPNHREGQPLCRVAAALLALGLAACSSVNGPAPVLDLPTPRQSAPSAPAPQASPPPRTEALVSKPSYSRATSAREYRLDAAKHLYALNAQRIYHGKLPPQLYAIGVLNVDLDAHGRVLGLNWMRAPTHAPEVIAEIERTVRQAAPYPIPERLGHVTYTDVWLWDESGQFQLDTLTEGQLDGEGS